MHAPVAFDEFNFIRLVILDILSNVALGQEVKVEVLLARANRPREIYGGVQ